MGKQGHGAVIGKALEGGEFVAAGGGHVGNQGILVVVLPARAESELFLQAGSAAVSHHQTLRGQCPAFTFGLQGHPDTFRQVFGASQCTPLSSNSRIRQSPIQRLSAT